MKEKRLRGHPKRRLWMTLLSLCAAMTAAPRFAAAQPTCDDSCGSPQSCTFDGLPVTALGNAALSVNAACSLVVDNIGSSGQDGYAVMTLPPNTGLVAATFACPNFAESVQGDAETVLVRGNVAGGVFCSTTVLNRGTDGIDVDPSFPGFKTKYTVTVKNNGVITAVFTDLPSARFTMGQCDQEEVC